MSLVEAAVWVFWGAVVLAVVRMLVAARLSATTEAQVKALRSELEQLRIKDRLESLEAGQLTLSNKVESTKVHGLPRNRRWGQ